MQCASVLRLFLKINGIYNRTIVLNLMKRSFVLLLSCFVMVFSLLIACGEKSQDKPQVRKSESKEDSLAFHLALTPTVDCLPFFYAEQNGIFKKQGLHTKLHLCNAVFECDTLLLTGKVQGALSDEFRMEKFRGDGLKLTPVMRLRSEWSIFGSNVLKLKSAKDLRNRTVVGERFSLSEFLIKETLRGYGLTDVDILMPQINALFLRTQMLDNNQIDAAILPEPFATMARVAGHDELCRIEDEFTELSCLVFPDSILMDAVRRKQVELLLVGYNKAVTEINEKGLKSCRNVLMHEFKVPRHVVDSVRLPEYSEISMLKDIPAL